MWLWSHGHSVNSRPSCCTSSSYAIELTCLMGVARQLAGSDWNSNSSSAASHHARSVFAYEHRTLATSQSANTHCCKRGLRSGKHLRDDHHHYYRGVSQPPSLVGWTGWSPLDLRSRPFASIGRKVACVGACLNEAHSTLPDVP